MTAPELINDEPEYEVEALLNKRNRKGQVEYLVKWKNWDIAYNSWVRGEDMEHALELREEYDSKHSTKKHRRK